MQKYNFEIDLNLCLNQHKGLRFSVVDNKRIVSGFIRVINPETKKSPVTYNVRMEIPNTFPYAFPKVFEIGGKFPINDNGKYHINFDNTLCIDVKPSEVIKTKNGLSLVKFVSQELIPNLSWRYCVLHGFSFNKAEWNHGEYGLLEFYMITLREENIDYLLKLMEIYINPKRHNRNSVCFCSNKKMRSYKHCHERKQGALHIIGVKQVSNDYIKIKELIKNIIESKRAD